MSRSKANARSCGAAEIKAWSSEVEAISYYRHSDPEKRAWFIAECKKVGLDPTRTTLFDYLEADDKQSFSKPSSKKL